MKSHSCTRVFPNLSGLCVCVPFGSCCWNSCAYGEILSADSRTEPVTCLTIVCGSPSASGLRAAPPANLPTVTPAYSKIKAFWEINVWCSGWGSIPAESMPWYFGLVVRRALDNSALFKSVFCWTLIIAAICFQPSDELINKALFCYVSYKKAKYRYSIRRCILDSLAIRLIMSLLFPTGQVILRILKYFY